MPDSIHTYESDDITVSYDVDRCIHAAECVRGLPNVFDPERRPWIDPDQAEAGAIADVIRQCPTGALQYRRKDDGPAEPTPEANTIRIAPDGPLYVRGDVTITTPDGDTVLTDTRVALCRCGLSGNKPFCDNSHEDGFTDAGELHDITLKGDASADDALEISLAPDGPLLVRGPVTIEGASDACAGSKGALCRCGHSANKPFCDGSHNDVDFSTA
jgi:CDGSH-type Zn-finger protein/uncharacterized Fe-S cluster protein YjdI